MGEPSTWVRLESARDLGELVAQLRKLVRGRLWLQIVIGMVAGVGLGLALSPTGLEWVSPQTSEAVAGWLAMPGEVFLTMIRMIVIPLVVASIVVGIAGNEDLAAVRWLGLRLAPYFVATTFAAVLIGVAVTQLIEPGAYIDGGLLRAAVDADVQPPPAPDSLPLPERIVSILPANPMGAMLNESMLQIVVLAIFGGVAIASMDRAVAKPLLDLARAFQALAMRIVSWAMVLAPVAVFGLLARVTIEVGFDALVGISAYVGTVLAGLAVLTGLYLAIARVVAGRRVRDFLGALRSVQLLAFSTSSSAAVMPLSLRTAEDQLGVRPTVARFVIPVGATVNMDGTALYQVCAALFLAQAFGVELTPAALVVLAVTTVGASIGSPSAPGVGIAILATVLAAVGIPPSGVALIVGVDRILDMSRTAVNVTGDLTACVVMERFASSRAESA